MKRLIFEFSGKLWLGEGWVEKESEVQAVNRAIKEVTMEEGVDLKGRASIGIEKGPLYIYWPLAFLF